MFPKHWLWAGPYLLANHKLNILLVILTLLGISLLCAYGIEKNELSLEDFKNISSAKVKLVNDLEIAGIAIFPSGFVGLMVNINCSLKKS